MVMLAQNLLMFPRYSRSVLLFVILGFGVLSCWNIFDLIGMDEELNIMITGLSLMLVTYGVDQTAHRVITPFWYFLGSASFFGQRLTCYRIPGSISCTSASVPPEYRGTFSSYAPFLFLTRLKLNRSVPNYDFASQVRSFAPAVPHFKLTAGVVAVVHQRDGGG